jgi:hypothetical protein
MKRSPIRNKSKSSSAQTKRRIQALLRQIAIRRDGGCVLRGFAEAGICGPRKSDGELILQAEHLISRARSFSFGDMRNIGCVCRYHHFYFKQRNGRLYWEMIEKIIGPERWAWIKRAKADHKSYPTGLGDWLKIEMALKQELAA